jgi:hypothetical protein
MKLSGGSRYRLNGNRPYNSERFPFLESCPKYRDFLLTVTTVPLSALQDSETNDSMRKKHGMFWPDGFLERKRLKSPPKD